MSAEKIENYYNYKLNSYDTSSSASETIKAEDENSIFEQSDDIIKTEKSTSSIGFWGNIFGKIIDFIKHQFY